MSALRMRATAASTSAGSSISPRVIATPRLAPVTTSIPCSKTRPVIEVRTRSARSMAASSSVSPSHRMTNSSPPMRATMSPGRVAETRRRPMLVINASPFSCPRLSLMSFNLSTSKKMTETVEVVDRARSIASESLRMNNVRLGRPVNAS